MLLRSAIWVGATPYDCFFHSTEHYCKNKTDSDTKPFSFAVVARFALNQGCPPKKKGGSHLLFPRRYTLLSLLSIALALHYVLGLAWLFDCRNTAAALLIRKKKFLAQKRAPLFLLLAVLGGVRNPVPARKSTVNDQKIKKESKVNRKLSQKSSVQALRVFEKISIRRGE
ncbi:hypothetical protein [Flavobacterium granuli]|uniref:hypothetical protein n=1 Tax=Flavobacterium granuli TaxID=280093 RepID=UPI0009344E97|nr:hypothetical protein [Flavobacterium granuli]